MLLSYLWKTFRLVMTAIILILFVRTFVIEPGRVNGLSMEPTYFDDQLFFLNKFQLIFSKPERGQIIQAKMPGSEKLVMKRIIGLPGETVHIRDNSVYITTAGGTTSRLDEPYLGSDVATQTKDMKPRDYPTLRADEYFILGDNRRKSADSRDFGAVKREEIIGLVISST